MRREIHTTNRQRFPHIILVLIFICFGLFFIVPYTKAQSAPRIQKFTGSIKPEIGIQWYLLEDLQTGQELKILAQTTSGNLDPFIFLVDSRTALGGIERDYQSQVTDAISNGRDPLLVIPAFSDENFLAWDDDSGPGFAAALDYTIPEDGYYYLGIISSPFGDTSGSYRLLVGLDSQDLHRDSTPVGDPIGVFQVEISDANISSQVINGSFTPEKNQTFFELEDFAQGDTLYVWIETTSGDLIPEIELQILGVKTLRTGNYLPGTQQAILEYTFPEDSSDFRLHVAASTGTTGNYRLILGRNAPYVLKGEGENLGAPIAKQPIPVSVGIKLQQITDVDQKAENFSAVVSLSMIWTDPNLSFDPAQCQCEGKVFQKDDFEEFVNNNNIFWPSFTLFNQQGNRWIQNKLVVVFPNGRVTYFERFTTTFQAPDFNFKQFPLDKQQFFIHIDMLYPVEYFVFVIDSNFNQVGEQLGEEEWTIIENTTQVSNQRANTRNITSRFSFGFKSIRQLTFYIFRIFVPLLLIIIVAWITFFLQDYGKRVDVTTGNLLLFIAFNFTISSELPRLGYLTYLDNLLVSTFIISVFVVAFNVYLKRQEVKGVETRATRLDKYMLWLYPLIYVLAFSIVTFRYFF